MFLHVAFGVDKACPATKLPETYKKPSTLLTRKTKVASCNMSTDVANFSLKCTVSLAKHATGSNVSRDDKKIGQCLSIKSNLTKVASCCLSIQGFSKTKCLKNTMWIGSRDSKIAPIITMKNFSELS